MSAVPRTIALLAAVAAVGALATAATSASNSTSPLQLTLKRADLPASSTFESELGLDSSLKQALVATGTHGQAARYLGASYSRTNGFLQVTGVVLAIREGSARKAFSAVRKARIASTRRPGGDPWNAVSLPRYGDEQSTRMNPAGNEGIGIVELIVRRNRVVWLLVVTVERRPKPTAAELLAVTRQFAAKQQRRVGAAR